MNRCGMNCVGTAELYFRPVVSRVNDPLIEMLAAPASADQPSSRRVPAGFQKMRDASEQPPAVTAKLRPMAHDPTSFSAKPCAPANDGSRSPAVNNSNDRVAGRSNMTILQKVWSGRGRLSDARWKWPTSRHFGLECERGRAVQWLQYMFMARQSSARARTKKHFRAP